MHDDRHPPLEELLDMDRERAWSAIARELGAAVQRCVVLWSRERRPAKTRDCGTCTRRVQDARYISLQQAAKLSSLSERSIMRHLRAGRFRGGLVGERILIDREDFLRFLRESIGGDR